MSKNKGAKKTGPDEQPAGSAIDGAGLDKKLREVMIEFHGVIDKHSDGLNPIDTLKLTLGSLTYLLAVTYKAGATSGMMVPDDQAFAAAAHQKILDAISISNEISQKGGTELKH